MKGLIFASVMLLCACTSTEQLEQETGALAAPVAVFYGTDRNRRNEKKPSQFYGFGRGQFEYGVASVAGAPNTAKTTVTAVGPLPRETFLGQLQAAVDDTPEHSALVFVHGFNRSFNQVAKLLAEFVDQTDFRGVVLMWSWPSARNPAGYLVDETNMNWGQPHFARFLQDVISESGAETVHLIGHSMGGKGLTEVLLQDLLPAGVDKTRVGEYILLAPDIDSAIFKRDLAPALVAADLRVTLYTSANDKALATSRAMHGYSRAGDSNGGPLLIKGVETIDVTAANKSVLGHSYFEESEMVTEDLARLLNDRKGAAQREKLLYVEGEEGAYWHLSVNR